MTRERNITRVDHGRTHGWWVRFQRLNRHGKKRILSRLFSDEINGGRNKSLGLARQWRDEMAAKLDPPKKRGGPDVVPPGYGYVKRVEIKRRAEYHPVYLAWIRLEGRKAASTTWSVGVWGETEAKRRCQRFLVRKRRELRKRSGGLESVS